jgi:hypothetical protein
MKRPTSLIDYLLLSIIGLLLISLVGGGLLLADLLPSSFVEELTTVFSIPAGLVRISVVPLLAVVGLMFIKYGGTVSRSNSLVSAELNPEAARNAPRLIGDQFDSSVDEALRDVRLKDADFENTEPRQILYDTTHTAVRLALSCGDEEAARVLSEGDWATDPVAKAFLSDTQKPPAGFRLLKWAKPGKAYEIALDRTSNATYQLISQARADTPLSEDIPSTSEANGLLSPLRAMLLAQQSEPAVTEPEPGLRADRQQSEEVPPSPPAATEPPVEGER